MLKWYSGQVRSQWIVGVLTFIQLFTGCGHLSPGECALVLVLRWSTITDISGQRDVAWSLTQVSIPSENTFNLNSPRDSVMNIIKSWVSHVPNYAFRRILWWWWSNCCLHNILLVRSTVTTRTPQRFYILEGINVALLLHKARILCRRTSPKETR